MVLHLTNQRPVGAFSFDPLSRQRRLRPGPIIAVALSMGLSFPLHAVEKSLDVQQKGLKPAVVEQEGDKARAGATLWYKKAVEAWREVEAAAVRVKDSRGAARARVMRRAIGLTLCDHTAFREYGQLSSRDRVRPLEIASLSTSAAPKAELDALVRFFRRAGRAYFLSKAREERDVPHLFEALALAYRLRADVDQAGADEKYRYALADLTSNRVRRSTLGASVARCRLTYKLRDFDGAQKVARTLPDEIAGLEDEDRIRLLALLRDLAYWRGDNRSAVALTRRLSRIKTKAEEQPPATAPLPTFVLGSVTDLRRVSSTLSHVVRLEKLLPRERVVAAYVAGVATLESGEPAAAIEYFALIEDVDRSGTWIGVQVWAHEAEAHARIGDYEGALASYRRALSEVESLAGVVDFRARLSLNIAGVLLRLGDNVGARRVAGDVLRSRDLSLELRVRARLTLGDALYFSSAPGPSKAHELMTDALAAYKLAARDFAAGRSHIGHVASELEAQIFTHQGNAHFRLAALAQEDQVRAAELERAIGFAKAVLRIQSRKDVAGTGLARLQAVAASNLGELFLESGDFSAAGRFIESALDRARKQGLPETAWRAHWYLGRLADARRDRASADREYAEAASIVERQRSRILDAELKVGYMSSKRQFFEAMCARELALGNGERAFMSAERARSRAFVESLGLRFLLLATDRDRALYREYVSLISRAAHARSRAGELFGVRHAEKKGFDDLRHQIKALKETVRDTPSISPVVRALVAGNPVDVAAVQGVLRGREVLIAYFSTGREIVAFVVGRKSFHAVPLGAGTGQIAGRVDRFVAEYAGNAEAAAELYRGLVAPLEAAVGSALEGEAKSGSGGGVPRVIVVPWGPLHRLPFEALLRTPTSGRPTYLIQHWEIAYLPSATVMRYLKRRPTQSKPKRLVAFVDPHTDYDADGQPDYPELPFAKKEVAAIASMFEDRVVLEGAEALEEACVRLIAAADVVHMACHGEFFPSRPLDSTLYLSGGGGEDGRLRASEVFGIDLSRSRLISLSGCETGRIDVRPGDEPVGLGTAFLHSGASALLVSLWKVEDKATAKLMETFYKAWMSQPGVDRASALRKTKLSMLRGGSFSHPRQWASFVLIGLR